MLRPLNNTAGRQQKDRGLRMMRRALSSFYPLPFAKTGTCQIYLSFLLIFVTSRYDTANSTAMKPTKPQVLPPFDAM